MDICLFSVIYCEKNCAVCIKKRYVFCEKEINKVNDRPVDEFGRDYRQVTPKGMRKLSGKRIEFGRDSGEGH